MFTKRRYQGLTKDSSFILRWTLSGVTAVNYFKSQINQTFASQMLMQSVDRAPNKHIPKFEINWIWHRRDIGS